MKKLLRCLILFIIMLSPSISFAGQNNIKIVDKFRIPVDMLDEFMIYKICIDHKVFLVNQNNITQVFETRGGGGADYFLSPEYCK